MIQQINIQLPAYGRGFHIITKQIEEALGNHLPKQGLLHLFILHTSAGLSINENADPSVRQDFETAFNCIAPENAPHYTHTAEGPDDMPAHIKASLVGSSVSVPIQNHRLYLGRWQGIYLCEFRNHPHQRRLVATLYS